jgi:phage shock protein A
MEYDLTGMSAAEAKDYLLNLITTIKLSEKELSSLMEETAKWKSRVELARSKGMDDILAEAEREIERITIRMVSLGEEITSYKNGVETIRRQLPGLAARERSIDPDLLEQELLMALGQTEEEAATEKAFKKLEKENSADSALEALKAKMKGETT